MASACSVSVPGAALSVPNPPPPTRLSAKAATVDPAHITAEAVFGDLVFVDLCLFLRADDLKSLGTPKLISPEAFDACAYSITRADGSVIEVEAHEIDSLEGGPGDDPELIDLGGGLKSLVFDDETVGCTQGVVFPDDVTFMVDVYSEGPKDGLCPIAAKVVTSMVARFDDGLVSQRVINADSLARVDACDLLPPSATEHVPGLNSRSGLSPLTKHECHYGDPDTSSMSLTLAAGWIDFEGTDRRNVTLAGRPTTIAGGPGTPEDGFVDCWAMTYVNPIAIDGLAAQAEYAHISVWVKESDADAACPALHKVLEVVWPKLSR
ncbi:hypothetical protein [Alloactinosynnema sp. L-07]|uniref:hypothetical protein n=1 Tax=Alloactinosynnema sp. L-07 TaxID=1653480 RepID=UPI0012F7922D|nr:hypothetical protein [Alloactinosynnema sp. L-07]